MASNDIERFESILKPAEDKRDYLGLRLSNNLKVLLVSDPETDISAASLSVHVGSMYDPFELQGLAHFLEHMLFMGTKKVCDYYHLHYFQYISNLTITNNIYLKIQTVSIRR